MSGEEMPHLPPGHDPSRLGVFWHWYGRPFRLLPKFRHQMDGPDGVTSLSWLGMQWAVFYGMGAEMATERLVPQKEVQG